MHSITIAVPLPPDLSIPDYLTMTTQAHRRREPTDALMSLNYTLVLRLLSMEAVSRL
jgi:hypothetical protein